MSEPAELDLLAVGTDAVVAGELIESAWGNQVRADLLAHDALLERLRGDSGSTAITVGSGFTGSITYRRIGAVASVAIAVTKSGSNIVDTDATLGTVAEVAGRPSGTIYGTAFVSNPNRTLARLLIATSGVIQANVTVNVGGIIYGSMTWLVPLP